MSELPPTTPLERYLDGQLTAADRQRVERALESNPAAREQVRLQREMDQALGRLFAAAPAHPLPLPVGRRTPTWAWGLAAAVLLAAAGVWAVWFRAPATRTPVPNALAVLYRAQVDSGFVPKQVCTTREAFSDWVRTYYQQPLYPSEPHEGVEFVGWNYAPAVGKHSGVLLARAQGKEVIVVIDRAVLEKQPLTENCDAALHIFREQVGPLVLYEVSPLDKAAILPLLSTTK